MAYIDKESTIKELEKVPAYFDSGDIRYGIDIATQQVIEQPTADVVEVVRCKDCKYREEIPNKNIWCAHHFVFMAMKPDDYCSKGERKDGE